MIAIEVAPTIDFDPRAVRMQDLQNFALALPCGNALGPSVAAGDLEYQLILRFSHVAASLTPSAASGSDVNRMSTRG